MSWFKQLFCWHDLKKLPKSKHNFINWYVRKCVKCDAIVNIKLRK